MNSSFVARPVRGAALVLVFALALAACGGSTKTSAPTTTTPTTTPSRASRLAAYEACLKSNLPAGTALPTSGFGFGGARGGAGGGAPGSVPTGSFPTTTLPAGVTSAQWSAALSTCRSKLPARGAGGGGFNSAALSAYRNCLNAYLAANGATTLPSTGGGFGGAGAGATTNPTMQAAQAHCAALRPTFGSTTASTT